MGFEDIESAALRLDIHQRAKLAASLLGSLDDLPPEENQRLWAEEAARRQAMTVGISGMREAGEVLAELRASLRS